MRTRWMPSIVLVAAAAGLGPSWADIDVPVRSGDRIVGTLEPATEVETFRFELPQGAVLKVIGKGRRTRVRPDAPTVRLRLLDRFDRDIPGDVVRNTNRSARIKRFVAPESGAYAVELRGDGFRVGDYSLTVKWKSRTKMRFKNVDTSQGLQELDFAADGGARIDVKAKARRNSPSRPVVFQLLRVVGGGTEAVKTFTFPAVPQKTHHVEADIPRTGDHRLIVRDGGGFGGPTDVSLAVHRPGGRRDVDVTANEVDPPPAGVDILATLVVGPEGGATPPGIPALTIPAAALARLRPVQLGVGDPFEGPAGEGLLPVGASVYVGPERVQFDRLVPVVLPMDAEQFPAGTSSLRVVRLESTGLRTVLAAQSVVADTAAGSATCPIARGGLYGAFRLVPPPSPTSVTPFIGSPAGGFEITLGGSGFRDTRDEFGERYLQITLDGVVVDVEILSVSPTLVGFTAPAHAAGKVTWGVRDRETGLLGELPTDSFWYQ